MIRRAVVVFLLLLPGYLWAQAIPDPPIRRTIELRVGVREFARPFSYRPKPGNSPCPAVNLETIKSGPLRQCGYEGYVVYICDEVLKSMAMTDPAAAGLQFTVTAVSVEEATDAAKRGDRLEGLGRDFDILCDPATISRDRVRRFSVSAPVFATGIGYLQLPPRDVFGTSLLPKCTVGVVGATNAMRHGLLKILAAGEWEKREAAILAHIKAGKEGSEQGEDAVCEFKNHGKLAAAFCAREVRYAVGDAEIIMENARQEPGCEPTPSAIAYTDDRYGIFAATSRDRDKALLIARFMDVLTREIVASDSLLDRAYLYEFGDRAKSQRLEAFFWAIRGSP